MARRLTSYDDIMDDMEQKLEQAHPTLCRAVPAILTALWGLGFPAAVFEGQRSAEQQADLYARGRTKAGGIVTNADGVTRKSKHQIQDDGFFHAVDVVYLKNGQFSWRGEHPWPLLGAIAEALDLRWGGRWKLRDYPHIELPF